MELFGYSFPQFDFANYSLMMLFNKFVWFSLNQTRSVSEQGFTFLFGMERGCVKDEKTA